MEKYPIFADSIEIYRNQGSKTIGQHVDFNNQLFRANARCCGSSAIMYLKIFNFILSSQIKSVIVQLYYSVNFPVDTNIDYCVQIVNCKFYK